MKVQQFKLGRKTEDGGKSFMITWLPTDSRLQENTIITLKGEPDVEWIIVERYKGTMDISEINTHWDNNHRRTAEDRGKVADLK